NRISINQALIQFTREIANNLISNGDLDENEYGWINDPDLPFTDIDLQSESIFEDNESEGDNQYE
ncbi:MAG: hypothetical protein ACRCX2_20020, partial [Paraclostridium sp.]